VQRRAWQSSTQSTVSGTRAPSSSQSCVMPAFTASSPTRWERGARGRASSGGMARCVGRAADAAASDASTSAWMLSGSGKKRGLTA